MKEIKFTSYVGRFAYSITAEVGEQVDAKSTALCIRGLADTGFRAMATEVEKALVKHGGNDVDGQPITKDTKRNAIGFSEERKLVVETAAQAKLIEVAEKDGLPDMLIEVTGEHVVGEGGASPMVRATTLVDTLLAKPETEKQLRATLMMFDPTALDADRDGLIQIANAAGLGIQPPKKKA